MQTRRSALLFLAPLLAAACGRPPAGRPIDVATPVAATTAAVAEIAWPDRFEAGGVLQSRTSAAIASQLMARIAAVRVRPGDRVTRGQPLIELDGPEWTAAAARASSASTAAAEHRDVAAADLDRARAQLILARATHARAADLAAKRAATPQELDQAVAALAAAEAGLRTAEASVREATAAHDAAAAGNRAASAEAAHLILTAPFNGIVRTRLADAGSVAVPGAPLLILDDVTSLQLVVRLDASRGLSLRVHDPVEVLADTDNASAGESAAPIAGDVQEVGRTGADGGTFEIKIAVPSGVARAGGFARARFTAGTRRTLVVPASAIVHRGQLAFVLVAQEQRARLRAVSIGESDGTRVEILDGLSAGELVITSPDDRLRDGAAISLTGAGR